MLSSRISLFIVAVVKTASAPTKAGILTSQLVFITHQQFALFSPAVVCHQLREIRVSPTLKRESRSSMLQMNMQMRMDGLDQDCTCAPCVHSYSSI